MMSTATYAKTATYDKNTYANSTARTQRLKYTFLCDLRIVAGHTPLEQTNTLATSVFLYD